MADPRCDFCQSPNPIWVYPANNFLVVLETIVIANSVAGWEACEKCHGILESGDSKAFAIHCVDAYVMEHLNSIDDIDWVRRCILTIHKQFFLHQNGPAYQKVVV